MLFRYDFGEKLDLTQFKKQVVHYIVSVSETEYHIYTKDFKIIFYTTLNAESISAKIIVYSLFRDSGNQITRCNTISFDKDSRFESFPEIFKLFGPYNMKFAEFNSKSPKEIVDKICMLIKIIHKINHLKAFM